MNKLEKITDRNILLRKINVEKVLFRSDGDEVFFKSLATYKIKSNKDNEVVINLSIESRFNPEIAFKAYSEFDVVVVCESPLENNEIEENIEDILYPVGSELSLLLACISKNMIGNPIIIPPVIDKFEREKI